MTGVLDPIPETTDHDTSLVEWFLSLTPAQRLAELDSRVSFLASMRQRNERGQLRPNS